MYLFLYGLFLGFSIGATIGPIAILCMRRSMVEGFSIGIATGIGASLAHLIFGSIAVFGLHFVQSFFTTYGIVIRIIGSLIIIAIAYRIYRNPISLDNDGYKPVGYNAALLSALLINLSNPVTIASYAAFISIINLNIDSLHQGLQFLSGIFFGNLGWWVILSFVSVYIRSLLSKKHLSYINVISAALLTGLALIGIGSALIQLAR